MSDIHATLAQRGGTHGDFRDNARLAQELKGVIADAPNWFMLEPDQREALHMIASKVSRILSGNANEPDHWLDIAGYATLVSVRLAGTGK